MTTINLAWFYGISTIVGYLLPNPLYTFISNICDLVWLGLWHINHCKLFNANSSLYIYINYMWFGLVGLYGISTIGYSIPNPLYSYWIYIIWLGWVLWHINLCRLFNAKSSLYIINIYDLVWLGFIAYQPLLVIQYQILSIHIEYIWFGFMAYQPLYVI